MYEVHPDARAALTALQSGGLTIATAESLTGGLLAAELTAVAGSSAVVRGGIVAYDVEAKQRLLAVPAPVLDRHGPVHPDVAAWMAAGACAALRSRVAVSTTGVAGPQHHGGQPPGVVFLGWRVDAAHGVVAARLPGDRHAVRQAATVVALRMLRQCARTGTVRVELIGGPGELSEAGATIDP